jgi:hypothetical protein
MKESVVGIKGKCTKRKRTDETDERKRCTKRMKR